MEIEIPADADGFILLQCNLCGEFFKLKVNDINDESTINIWCPYCGLNGKEYYTEEVIDISLKIAKIESNRIIYNALKEFERKTKSNKFLTFKCGKEPDKEVITPIKSRIDNLETFKYKCCNSRAKIKPISITTGSYCPLCGGANFE